jgi:hypothetical protein
VRTFPAFLIFFIQQLEQRRTSLLIVTKKVTIVFGVGYFGIRQLGSIK